ncbi:MAG: tetratricopeptide repeat protein [Deltaproteobacteria bacterium]|nr:tetratricopeptide repeat protein [Deltaproteobacteria bacterium]
MKQKAVKKMLVMVGVFLLFSLNQNLFADDLETQKKECESKCWAGNHKEGIEICKKVLDQEPSHVPSIYMIARAYRSLEDYDTALKWYAKGLESDPKHVSLIASRGYLYLKLGKIREAYEAAQKAISIDPQASEGYELMGSIFDDKKDYAKAMGYYNSALEYAKEEHRKKSFRARISSCYFQLSRLTKDAEKQLEYHLSAQKIYPEGWFEYAVLSDYYKNHNQSEKAYEYAMKTLDHNPPEKWKKEYQGKVADYYISNSRKETDDTRKLEYLHKALKAAPNYFFVYAVFSDYHIQKGNKEEAAKYALQALKFNLNSYNKMLMSLRVAQFHDGKDDYPNAYKYYRDVCFAMGYNEKTKKFTSFGFSHEKDLKNFYFPAYRRMIATQDFVKEQYVEAKVLAYSYPFGKGSNRIVNGGLKVEIDRIEVNIYGDIPYLGLGFKPGEMVKLYVKDFLDEKNPHYHCPGKSYKFLSFEKSYQLAKESEAHKTMTGMVLRYTDHDESVKLLSDGKEYEIKPIGKELDIKVGDKIVAEIYIEKQYQNKVYKCNLIKFVKKDKPDMVLIGQLKKKNKRSDYYGNPVPFFVVAADNQEYHVYDMSGKYFSLFEEGDRVKFRVYKKYSSIEKYDPPRYSLYEIDPQLKANTIREKKQAYANYVNQLKTGKRKIKTVKDAITKYDASKDNTYTRKPPINEPKQKSQYFVWNGKLVRNEKRLIGSDIYIVWEAQVNPFYEAFAALGAKLIHTRGFAFKNIEESFGEINMDSTVTVVGRYDENMEIQLINGEKKLIAVLTDCYIW